jgi:hypothetical protein
LKHQHTSGNWKGLSNSRQRNLFNQAVADGVLGGQKLEFETYAELMRVRLDKLERVAVDCDAIPFGHDNISTADGGRTGMYRAMHGKTFYLGPKQWLAHAGTNWTFLTTERLVTDVIEKLYEKMKKYLIPLRLDTMPDIYPIRVPVFIDLRAAADKPGVTKVSAIAREIMNSNSDAVVVSVVPFAAGLRNPPRRLQPTHIAMQQKRHHHARVKRRLPEPAYIAAGNLLEIEALRTSSTINRQTWPFGTKSCTFGGSSSV